MGVDHSLWLKTVVLVLLAELVSHWELPILLVSSYFTGNSAISELIHLQKIFATSTGIQYDPPNCGQGRGKKANLQLFILPYIALGTGSL